MDLRMVKTRRQIKTAFLKLREKFMPEDIKVKDICDEAMINKTTFYNHYTDSIALSEEIDNGVIDSIISNFSEWNKIFDDPRIYAKNLLLALERNADEIKKVFRGKQGVLCTKLEERLYSLCGGMAKSSEDGVLMSFAIGGFVRIGNDYLFSNKKYSLDEISEYSAKMLEALIHQKTLFSQDII